MTRIVTGLFEGRRTVDLVVEHLVQEVGIPRERVQVHAADPATGAESRAAQDDDQDASLLELGLPDAAVRACGEAMRGGAILLAAWVEDGQAGRALATCREHGASRAEAHAADMQAMMGRDPDQRARVQAYLLWEREGRPEGRDLEFWDRARRFVEDGQA